MRAPRSARLSWAPAGALLAHLLVSAAAAGEVPWPPRIDPLGSREAYSQVSYSPQTSSYVTTGLLAGQEAKRQVRGERWLLDVRHEAAQGAEARAAYEKALVALGGVVTVDQGGRLGHRVEDPTKGEAWWSLAGFSHGSYRVEVVRTLVLRPELPVEVALGGAAPSEPYLYADIPGTHLTTLEVSAPAGFLQIGWSQDMSQGAYRRRLSDARGLRQTARRAYHLTDVPQDAGPYEFRVGGRGGADPPDTVRLVLRQGDPIPVVTQGEAMGGLRVQGAPYGLVTAAPEGDAGLTHPEFSPDSTRGDVTPRGDALLILPPGLWKVGVAPPKDSGVTGTETRLVPVHAGRQTVLRWPPSATRAYGREGQGAVEITEAEASSGEATLHFHLLGDEAAGVTPSTSSVEVQEGERAGEVLEVRHLETPPDVVLLLDSSGSMKGTMAKALEETRRFLRALPAGSVVRVVDFDTTHKVLPGTTVQAALAGLGSVEARGATALYDTLLEGLKMCAGRRRAALVLFTDGVDANWNDTAPGSKSSKAQVLRAVREARVPVFTIGFGAKHDRDTLNRVAALSGGLYLPAQQAGDLGAAFGRVVAGLGRAYAVRYRRPPRPAPSDVPVVHFTIDTSGSMGEPIGDRGTSARMDVLKELLGDLVRAKSDTTLMAVQTFEGASVIRQVPTHRGTEILRALAMLRPGGSTEVVAAIETAVATLAAVPSTRRYLVFVTDAALSVSGASRERFETALGRLVDEGVRCLWVGLGLDPKDAALKAAFDEAARLTGGQAVVSADPLALAAAFEQLTRALGEAPPPGPARTVVRLSVQDRLPSGRVRAFSAAQLRDFPTAALGEGVEAPEAPAFHVTALPPRYDAATSRYLTGDGPPRRDSVISRRLPLGLETGNRAVRVVAEEALVLSRLRGLEAPESRRFLGLTLAFVNRLPAEDVVVYEDGAQHPAAWVGGEAGGGRVERRVPTYLIGDLQRHLFLRFNEDTQVPLSTATWLAAAPLVLPGVVGLSIPAETPVTGTAVFLVPDAPVFQASLHFHDTNYGSFHLPLIGEMPPPPAPGALPEVPPVELGQAFALRFRGIEDSPRVGEVEAGEGTTFRLVDLDLESRVGALLQVDPLARVSLRLPSHRGELHVPLHGVTALTPFGFARPTFFPPGSNNRIRLAFRVPEVLARGPARGEVVVDLKGRDVRVSLADPARPAPATPAPPREGRLRGDGIEVLVNALGARERLDGTRGRWRVADLTLLDAADGASTQVPDSFELVRDDAGAESWRARTPEEMSETKGLAGFASGNATRIELRVAPDATTSTRLFGLPPGVVVPDGGERRGVLVFLLPEQDDQGHTWWLRSRHFPDLAVKVPESEFASDTMLLARRPVASALRDRELEGFQRALEAAVQEHRVRETTRPRAPRVGRVGLEGDALPKHEVPPPALVVPGAEALASMRDLEALRALASRLRWVPGPGVRAREAWAIAHAPEAVLTQGWGSSADLARMAELALIRQGILPARVAVRVTEAGRAALASRAGLARAEDLPLSWLPALRYQDSGGAPHLLVVPFLQDATALPDLVDATAPEEARELDSVRVRVEAWTMPVVSAQAEKTRDMAAALTGGGGAAAPQTRSLLEIQTSLEDLSRRPVEVGYTEGSDAEGRFFTAVLDGPQGRVLGKTKLHPRTEKVLGLRVLVRFESEWLVHEHPLAEGEEPTGVFHALGLGLPDLPPEAATRLEAARRAARAGVERPDELSALRWYTSGVIGRFLAGQTRLEARLAARLGVRVGRVSRPRALVVTASRARAEGPVRTVLDLRRVGNQVHAGAPEARRAFALLAGLAAGRLEEEALPGGGRGLFHVWSQLPPEAEIFAIGPRDRRAVAETMRGLGYPTTLVERVGRGSEVLLFPSRPAEVDGRPRWAWIEVDPQSYEAVTVLADGSHGAMVEVSIENWATEAAMYMVGALVGIDAALWSVSAFSLELDDEDEIMERAEAFAKALGERLEGLSVGGKLSGAELAAKAGIGSLPKVEGSAGAFKFQLEKDTIKLGENLLGFGNGYKAAVAYYFAE